jgi:Flp pilus assembly protein TadG
VKPAPHTHRRRAFFRDERAVAAVEFGIVGPLMAYLLWGAMSFGGYFYIAHGVQQLANDAARAAIAGLNDSERDALVGDCVAREKDGLAALRQARLTVTTERRADTFTVQISYDASGSPFWAFSRIGPMPASMVTRSGTILVGGY